MGTQEQTAWVYATPMGQKTGTDWLGRGTPELRQRRRKSHRVHAAEGLFAQRQRHRVSSHEQEFNKQTSNTKSPNNIRPLITRFEMLASNLSACFVLFIFIRLKLLKLEMIPK